MRTGRAWTVGALLFSGLLMMVGTGQAFAAAVFNASASSITAILDPDIGSGGAGQSLGTIPIPLGSPSITNTLTLPTNAPNAQAAIGAARTQSSSSAELKLAAGTGVGQFDPQDRLANSRLTVDFSFVWNVTSPGFGPPLLGDFSVPIGGTVKPNGRAAFDVNVFWDAVIDGVQVGNLRSPYSASGVWDNAGNSTNLSFLQSFSASAQRLEISSFSPGDQFILRGRMRFNANDRPLSASLASLTLKSGLQILNGDADDDDDGGRDQDDDEGGGNGQPRTSISIADEASQRMGFFVQDATVIPAPAAVWAGALLLGALGALKLRRR